MSSRRRAIARRASTDLEHYDPEIGLKRLAVAEAAEKHFTRAKDATYLSEAVELKLSEQRKFVLWWDGSGLNKPGSPILSDRKGMKAGQGGIPESITIHRWRIRLKAESKYQKTLEAAQQRCIRVCEASKGATAQRGASGTNENEWYTPKFYVEAARSVLGAIDLDPASAVHAQGWIKAERFFTKKDDGLAREWLGRVWLNPPYMQPDIASFVSKLVDEVAAGRTTAAILLTHNYTDTAWFHLAAGACAAICFTRGRVAFIDLEGTPAAPTQGQAFFYFGQDITTFAARFASIGAVLKPAWRSGSMDAKSAGANAILILVGLTGEIPRIPISVVPTRMRSLCPSGVTSCFFSSGNIREKLSLRGNFGSSRD